MISLHNFKDLISGKYEVDEEVDVGGLHGKVTVHDLYNAERMVIHEMNPKIDDTEFQSFSDLGKKTVKPKLQKDEDVVIEKNEAPQFVVKTELERMRLENEQRELEAEKNEYIRLQALVKEELEEAKTLADEIIAKATKEAVDVKEQLMTQAKEQGYQDGFLLAKDEYLKDVNAETTKIFKELRKVIDDISGAKSDMLEDNVEQMKDVTIAVAEKIVQVSLRSSGEVIKKMIVAATDKMTAKEWVKIYVSKLDSAMIMQVDKAIVQELRTISNHVRIETIDNAAEGTCIIELPDQRIDASTNVQLSNMRELMNGAEYGSQ